MFAEQRKAILAYVRTGRIVVKGFAVKEEQYGDYVPRQWPNWDSFHLGALAVSKRMTPIISATWDEAGSKFAPRVGLDPDEWNVTNPYLAGQIQNLTLNFCDSTNQTTSEELDTALAKTREALHQGVIVEGEGVEQLTKRINEIFDQASKSRARAIAQTETSRSVHAAQDEAAKMSGVVYGWKWLVSADACDKCLAIAARCPAVKLGQPFAVIGDNPHYREIKYPPCHPHCVLPETPVIAPIGIAGIKASYDGPVVRLRFSDGSDVTVTPHHMLLTPQGFAFADSLMQGDDVLRYRIGESVSSSHPDDHYPPTPIEEIFNSWAKPERVTSSRVPASPEYLHGDAAFCKGDIRIVFSDRLLRNGFSSQSFEPFADGSFRWPDMNGIEFSRESDLAKVLFSLRDATDGGMSATRESKASVRAHLRMAVNRSLGISADTHALLNQVATDCSSADFHRIRDRQLRFASEITVCSVSAVETLHYVGPVYDISTATSLYLIGSGIINSNCNCTVVEILDTDEQPPHYATLEQPEGVTDEEHAELVRQQNESYERIWAGSNATPRALPPQPIVKPKEPKPARIPEAVKPVEIAPNPAPRAEPVKPSKPPQALKPGKLKDIEQVHAWMTATFPNAQITLDGIPVESWNHVSKELGKLAKEWPDVAKKLAKVGTSDELWDKNKNSRAYARADNNQGQFLTFNPNKWGSIDALKAEITKSSESGWFAKGITDPNYVVAHEWGHLVDAHLKVTNQNKWIDIRKVFSEKETDLDWKKAKAVSKYATTNRIEAIAESFAASRFQPKADQPQVVRDFVEALDR